jgi:hypothetical protein
MVVADRDDVDLRVAAYEAGADEKPLPLPEACRPEARQMPVVAAL